MALPGSGLLSLADIAGEFGGSPPDSLFEYYGVAAGIPGSGEIGIADFYGASSIQDTGLIRPTLSSSGTVVNAAAAIDGNVNSYAYGNYPGAEGWSGAANIHWMEVQFPALPNINAVSRIRMYTRASNSYCEYQFFGSTYMEYLDSLIFTRVNGSGYRPNNREQQILEIPKAFPFQSRFAYGDTGLRAEGDVYGGSEGVTVSANGWNDMFSSPNSVNWWRTGARFRIGIQVSSESAAWGSSRVYDFRIQVEYT